MIHRVPPALPLRALLVLGVLLFATPSAGEPTRDAVSFELDVQPILTAFGCNAGSCHGKSRGQNGFQLSLLGFDPEFDYAALTQQARGRRVFPSAPERSLVLLKPTARVAHGGGQKFTDRSNAYQVLRRWIETGMPRRLPDEPTLNTIQVTPVAVSMQTGISKPLVVTAVYSDGTTRDVTLLSAFQSNESGYASVSSHGVVTAGSIPGEAVIMARYMNVIATCRVTVPLPSSVPDEIFAGLPRKNFVDEMVWAKAKSLGFVPSPPINDAKFLRRAHLDIIGRIPNPDEVRSFLADTASDKRSRLIDRLLQRREYADFWANKWADLLRPNPYRVGIKAVLNFDDWIRDSFRQNKPFDQFVSELLTAQGSTWHNGAATLFRDRRSPDEIAPLVSQLFLGVRLECAKCHHHPFEKWGQDDFYSFAAYFARVGRKGRGLSPPISGSEELVLLGTKGTVVQPTSGQEMTPRPLFGEAPPLSADDDPRQALAQWITNPENKYFARAIVNRVWADMMGRGLVEPVDDFRATNPATNEPLLDALATEFQRQRFDLKQLIRTIAASYVYGLSSLPNERNAGDTRCYTRHYRKRMRAESLMDAVADVTGVPHKFKAMPAGTMATQIWTHRVESLFLDTFGRPDPNQDPPCERTRESTVTQVLHLMNSPALHKKVTSDAGRAAELAASERSPDAIVNEIYLTVYARFPDEAEQNFGRSLFEKEGTSRRQATEDLLWALLNTPEFIFVD